MTTRIIQLEGVCKRYEKQNVLNNVCLSVRENEVLAVCGPSGGGKSTLLRCINGLESIQAGKITVDGIQVDDNPRHLKQVRNRVGIVFQEFNLYSHMNVLSNLTLAQIKVLRVPRQQAREQGHALLAQFGLSNKAGAYPAQLSGGERQRVAIARSLMPQPKVLLLDEITSNLDPERVDEVLELVAGLVHRGQTMVLVTHHMGFAQRTADRIAFLDEGRLLEVQPTTSFFTSPKHERTRTFLEHAYLRSQQDALTKQIGPKRKIEPRKLDQPNNCSSARRGKDTKSNL